VSGSGTGVTGAHNKFVVRWSGLRFYHGSDSVVALVGGEYCCANPSCPDVIKKATRARATFPLNAESARQYWVQYSSFSNPQMALLPSSVRCDFPFVLTGSKGQRGGYDLALGNESMLSSAYGATFAADVKERYR